MAGNFCFHDSDMMNFIYENLKDIDAPLTAGIEITSKCNLRCIHCYGQNDRNRQEMSTDEIKKVIDLLCEKGTIEIFFTGGEIFTRKDFNEIYVYTRKKGILVALLTNITLLNQEHIEMFKEYPVEVISTTMYGYSKEVYEKVTGVKGSYETFMRAVDLLKNNGIKYELKFVAMEQNIDELYDVRRFGKELGVNMIIGLDIRATTDGDTQPVKCRISPERAFEFDLKDNSRVEFWQDVANQILSNDLCDLKNRGYVRKGSRYEENYLYPCSIGEQFVFITSDMRMQGCIKTPYASYNLKTGDFDTGWKFIKERFTNKKASRNFKCTSCDKSLLCEQCTASFALNNGCEEDVDDFYCKVAELRKEMMDNYIKNIKEY